MRPHRKRPWDLKLENILIDKGRSAMHKNLPSQWASTQMVIRAQADQDIILLRSEPLWIEPVVLGVVEAKLPQKQQHREN